jgi:Putative transposase/Transposase zinc-binding domain
VYERRDPFAQALHRVVRENLATFYAAIEEGWQTGLPEFVRSEFAGYLDCSVLQRGFAHLACEDCGLPRLVAFTCAGRGFCPTCLGRRMNQTTHNLLAHVVPAQPLRQWVLTLPFALRAPLAYETGLMSVVARVFEDSLLRWYERRLAPGDYTAQGGLLNVIQRSSGDMRLNPHLHVVALDGVYVAGPDGQPVFRALGRLKTDEVADVVQITKARVLKALARRGVVRVSPEALEVDDALADRDPVLAQLAAAAVAGLPPAGPVERKREPVALATGGGLEIVGDLVVQDCGFNLHAKTRAGAVDNEARARLLRYVLRPPLAQDRLAVLPDHRVRLTLKRPWSDGTFALEMDALALLARLASAVPPPKQHLTRYSGVLAAAAHWRPLIIPPAPVAPSASAEPAPPPTSTQAPPVFSKQPKPTPSGKRSLYIKWAELLRLTFGLTVDLCPACGGRMKLRALVRDPESIERFLRHQGLWAQPIDPAPARAPPYHRSVTRLAPTRQQELFPDT